MNSEIFTINGGAGIDVLSFQKFSYLPDIYREYRYVNYGLLVLAMIFLLYPLGVSIPGEVEAYLPFELPTVPSYIATNYPNLPCSSCGLTRSVVSLYHFDLDAALAFNKAGILIVALAIAQFFLRFPLLFWKSSGLCWFDLIQLVTYLWLSYSGVSRYNCLNFELISPPFPTPYYCVLIYTTC